MAGKNGLRIRLPKSLETALGQATHAIDVLTGLRDSVARASDDLATARPVVTFSPEGIHLDLGGPDVQQRNDGRRAPRSLGAGPDAPAPRRRNKPKPATKRKPPKRKPPKRKRTP